MVIGKNTATFCHNILSMANSFVFYYMQELWLIADKMYSREYAKSNIT